MEVSIQKCAAGHSEQKFKTGRYFVETLSLSLEA